MGEGTGIDLIGIDLYGIDLYGIEMFYKFYIFLIHDIIKIYFYIICILILLSKK